MTFIREWSIKVLQLRTAAAVFARGYVHVHRPGDRPCAWGQLSVVQSILCASCALCAPHTRQQAPMMASRQLQTGRPCSDATTVPSTILEIMRSNV